MAHAALHFSAGLAVGTAALLPSYIRHSRTGGKMAAFFGRWLVTAYGTGILAIVPGVFGNLGVPERVCGGWWMNVFVLHPLIEQAKPGGLVIGGFGMLFFTAVMYVLMLASLWKRLREKDAC